MIQIIHFVVFKISIANICIIFFKHKYFSRFFIIIGKLMDFCLARHRFPEVDRGWGEIRHLITDVIIL